jgi:hypothetical protein
VFSLGSIGGSDEADKGSAREFIEKVKRGKMPDEKLQFFNPAEKEGV